MSAVKPGRAGTSTAATSAAEVAGLDARSASLSAPMALALARLADTRAGLRQALLPPSETDRQGLAPDGAGGARWSPRLRAAWRHWRRQLHRWPLAGEWLASVQQAWRNQPWRPAAELLAQETSAAVLPAVRRHPVLAVALAAGLGVALVAGRAWYWPLVARPLRASPARLGRWLVQQLAQAPVQAGLLSLLVMLVQRGQSAAAAAPAAAASPAAAPPAAAPATAAPPARPTPAGV